MPREAIYGRNEKLYLIKFIVADKLCVTHFRGTPQWTRICRLSKNDSGEIIFCARSPRSEACEIVFDEKIDDLQSLRVLINERALHFSR